MSSEVDDDIRAAIAAAKEAVKSDAQSDLMSESRGKVDEGAVDAMLDNQEAKTLQRQNNEAVAHLNDANGSSDYGSPAISDAVDAARTNNEALDEIIEQNNENVNRARETIEHLNQEIANL
jgi:hypothetical protein